MFRISKSQNSGLLSQNFCFSINLWRIEHTCITNCCGNVLLPACLRWHTCRTPILPWLDQGWGDRHHAATQPNSCLLHFLTYDLQKITTSKLKTIICVKEVYQSLCNFLIKKMEKGEGQIPGQEMGQTLPGAQRYLILRSVARTNLQTIMIYNWKLLINFFVKPIYLSLSESDTLRTCTNSGPCMTIGLACKLAPPRRHRVANTTTLSSTRQINCMTDSSWVVREWLPFVSREQRVCSGNSC